MIVLTHGAAVALVDVHHGFGCTSLRLAHREVLGQKGIRVQFPWVGAGAARATRLHLGGTVRDLSGGPAGGLTQGEWTLDEAGQDDQGAWTRARLRTDGATAAYPFELELEATWRLDDEGLRLDLELTNGSRVHAPFGIGVRVHLAAVGECVQVLVPAEEYWRRDSTGGIVAAAPMAVTGQLDLRRPSPITKHIEGSFTRRHFANSCTQVALLSRCPLGREVWFTTSADFREAEVALDPDGAGIIESATCTPDAFALHADGVAAGLRLLAPGEVWRGSALLRVQPARDPA